VRTLTAPIATALGRRGLALERGAQLALRRDAYAPTPGPTLGLSIGERTHYRSGAWLLDTFERTALSASYATFGASGLTLTSGQLVPASVGPMGQVTHLWTVPRDPWAAIELAVLSGASARVGVLLRATDTDAYRIVATSAGQTIIERLVAGAPTTLATVTTPWRVGDVLRAELLWRRLRVYREPILVAELTVEEPGLSGLDGRHVGLVAQRAVAGDAAALRQFVGGEARQEYVGAGLDFGDIQRVLGQPATFEVTISNLAPLGGSPRFAALLRHGLNTGGTFDLDRGDVRVMTVIDGLAPPLTAGIGLIDGPAEVTEDRVRLACRGRDAFLTPQLAPGPVTYIPGPGPGGLTPLPADPCAPSAPPIIDAGLTPSEPDTPLVAVGIGPDAPPAIVPNEGDTDGTTLLGAYMIEMVYTLNVGGGPGGTDVYVGSTTVTRMTSRTVNLVTRSTIGTGSRTFPHEFRDLLYYRGSDITGLSLGPMPPSEGGPVGGAVGVEGRGTMGTGDLGIDIKLGAYTATGITSEAVLAALRPKNPSEGSDPFPARIKTIGEWHANYRGEIVTCTADPHGDAAFLSTQDPANGWVSPITVLLERTTGPQLLRLEITNAPTTAQIVAYIETTYVQTSGGEGFFGGSGTCGTGMHHFVTKVPYTAGAGATWLVP
jgi:hypothetical protein